MDLIERYVQAVGRRLPAQQREDIMNELRSALYDATDGAEDAEAAAVAAIKAMGAPEQAAAAYYPAGQYLIGPSLYPLFLRIAGLVLTVIIGLELATLIFAPLDALLGGRNHFLATLPTALGIVVLVFWGLQRSEAGVEAKRADFDPRRLPAAPQPGDSVERGSVIFDISINVLALWIFVGFLRAGGFQWEGATVLTNPVLAAYGPWIVASFAAGIVINVAVFWEGVWRRWSRLANLAVDVLSLGLVGVLIADHNAWLAEAGIGASLREIWVIGEAAPQVMGMQLLRMLLVATALILALMIAIQVYRLVRRPRAAARLSGPLAY